MDSECSLGEIAGAFAGIAGVEAVAWGGSTAMQKVDSLSDYDLYVYSRRAVPLAVRKTIIASRAADTNWTIAFGSWKTNGLNQTVCASTYLPIMPGSGRRGSQASCATYSFSWIHAAYCFSLSQGKNLADPNSWLINLQRQTQGRYPLGLVQAILRKNRPVLGGGMQSCYLKQINTAIVRQDPVSLNHRVTAWLASYFDILFAINGQFHPGEKRLLTFAGELADLPRGALLDVRQLCAFALKGESPIAVHLERMLGRLDDKLKEIGPVTLRLTTDEKDRFSPLFQGL